MNIILSRDIFQDERTLGTLIIPEASFSCFVLEDTDRNLYQQTPVADIVRAKVFGQTAIPYGRYEVAITWSNRFKCLMPEILSVPGFSGIRIHSGNRENETLGCPLTGFERNDTSVTRSREAFKALFAILKAACKKEKVFITVSKALVA